jgi:hypothetical protein
VSVVRDLLLTALCLGFSAYMAYFVFAGLRSGKVAHSEIESFCERSTNPLGYWALILLFAGFSAMGVYGWLASVLWS